MIGDRIRVHQQIFAGPQPEFMMMEQTANFHVLLTMETGSFEFKVNEHIGTASFGDLVFCPAGVSFKRKALSEVSFHHIQFELLPDANGLPPIQLPVGKISLTDTGRLQSTFTYLRRLKKYVNSVTPNANHVRDQIVVDILVQYELEKMLAKESLRRHADPLMEQAMSLIHEQALTQETSMQKIAKRLGLHPSQMTRRFVAAYGSTPIAYMTKLRLEEAKRLLIETNDTLESISYRCGYENGSYFCRVFTEKVGMNPSVFRHKHWI